MVNRSNFYFIFRLANFQLNALLKANYLLAGFMANLDRLKKYFLGNLLGSRFQHHN